MGRQTPEALLQFKTNLVYGTWTEMEAVHPTYPHRHVHTCNRSRWFWEKQKRQLPR